MNEKCTNMRRLPLLKGQEDAKVYNLRIFISISFWTFDCYNVSECCSRQYVENATINAHSYLLLVLKIQRAGRLGKLEQKIQQKNVGISLSDNPWTPSILKTGNKARLQFLSYIRSTTYQLQYENRYWLEILKWKICTHCFPMNSDRQYLENATKITNMLYCLPLVLETSR